MLVEITNTTKKSTKTPLKASREVGLQINTEKSKNIVLFHHQNYNLLIANKFKYLGTTVKNEIKSRLNMVDACYHSVQVPLSSSFLSKNL
jgi:hypothetical protein